jgi:hypothetical protein
VREQLTPLWTLPYAAQLARKFGAIAACLQGVTWDLARRAGEGYTPPWLQAALARAGGGWQPCCVLEARPTRLPHRCCRRGRPAGLLLRAFKECNGVAASCPCCDCTDVWLWSSLIKLELTPGG